MGKRRIIAFSIAAVCSACAPAPAKPSSGVPVPNAAPLGAATSGAAVPSTIETQDVLLVTDPSALNALEARGFGLGELLDGRRATDNGALAESPGYESLIRVLEVDVRAAATADPLAGTSVAKHAHRLFNAAWLRSGALGFELVGLVNRLDRRPFHQTACGELRLVYRLSYAKQQNGVALASRLPLTLSLELPQAPPDDKGSCAAVAAKWRADRALTGERLAEWLSGPDGPLTGPARHENPDVLVVANLQVVRWPATIRPDMAGHAEYVLRGFRRDARGERFVPAPLENTPDVARLKQSPALRRELLQWISDEPNLHRIDEGTALVPERFLTKLALSVTPRGFSRRANRPYRSLFRASEFSALDLQGRRFARSPEALLRRLDEQTCMGCHQLRSTAGFHLLGQDETGTPAVNSLREPVSTHVSQDLARRARVFADLAAGRSADFSRPFAERGAGDGGYGAHCGLGDPGFADWTCAPGFRCDAYEAPADDRSVGICLPEQPGGVGDPCQVGAVSPNDDSHRDRVGPPAKRECQRSGCSSNAVGFPGGMCTAACSDLPSEGACGGIAELDPFNNCLARGEPFTNCIERHVRPSGLRRCDAGMPCRDDYICARAPAGDGVCIPPYFLFQLRVDGHPL